MNGTVWGKIERKIKIEKKFIYKHKKAQKRSKMIRTST